MGAKSLRSSRKMIWAKSLRFSREEDIGIRFNAHPLPCRGLTEQENNSYAVPA